MICGKEHDLIVIYRGHGSDMCQDTIRWCQMCGAVVGDLDYDGRTNAGGVFEMRFPELVRERNRVK